MTDNFILSSGEEIPLIITRSSIARNISLRPKVAPERVIKITLPRFTSLSAALKFLEQKRKWVEKIFAASSKKIKLQPGDKLTIFGEEFLLLHKVVSRQPSAVSNVIVASGSLEFFERRVRDEIKKRFLAAAKECIKSAPASLRPKTISSRDTTSRWGSCSSSGCISLSWRLALAPPEVMRYVIMHELAHKKYMDHSSAFWRTVSELYGPGVERAKMWLSKNGSELYRYF
jgi:predicted metal-dependent hydrolase